MRETHARRTNQMSLYNVDPFSFIVFSLFSFYFIPFLLALLYFILECHQTLLLHLLPPLLWVLLLLEVIMMKTRSLLGNKSITMFVSHPLQKKLTLRSHIFHLATNQIKSIHRNKQVQTVYNQWMKDTLAKYGTIENYLLKTKLHFEPTTDKSRPSVIILPNDFPYSVEAGIQHILIWSQTPLASSYIEEILQKNYGPSYEWVYWVNPPEIQSVRKLPHVHVFLRHRLH